MSVRPSVRKNEYLGGCIWRIVSMYLNGIYSVDIQTLHCVAKIDLLGYKIVS